MRDDRTLAVTGVAFPATRAEQGNQHNDATPSNLERRRFSIMTTADPLADAARIARDNAVIAEELGLLIDGATNYAIYMLDPMGRVTIWNRGAERIKGWAEADIIGRSFATFYTPEDIAVGKPESDLADANRLGRIEEDSWRVRKDGSEFLASVTITALRDNAGALRGFGKVVRDITDQKASEAALLRREQHLRSILATVPDAMIVLDEGYNVSSFSTAAQLVFGYDESEVLGQNVTMLLPEDGLALNRFCQPSDARLSPVFGAAERRNATRKNGQIFPIELTMGEALIAGERILTGFVRDLTARQEGERKLRELQSELVHVSRVSAMGTMASTLAHEINQPLTAIANYLETTRAMIRDDTEPSLCEIAEALDLAAAQALRAGTIVRRLRAFVDGGDTGFQVERLDELVEDATSLGLLGAHEAGVKVTMIIAPGLDRVMVDRIQIQQVLVNLIRNAVQSMQDVPIRELTIATAPDRAGWVKVTVRDTGPGIGPEIRDRLFQAFATTKEDGMGLGLSICRTIIEAHGGRIWADPVATGGTAFHFCVPLADYAHE